MVNRCIVFIALLLQVTTALCQKVGTVPFSQLYGGVMIMKGKFANYPDTLNFVFDSGSSHISLDSATAAVMGIAVTQSSNYINGIGGYKLANVAQNLSLKLGNIQLPVFDFNVNNYELLSQSTGIRVDGIVGYAFISKYILQVNFDSSIIHAYNIGTLKYPKRGYIWSYDLDYLPRTQMPIREQKSMRLPYYIDCGAGLSLLLSKQFVQDSTLFAPNKKIVSMIIEGMGGRTITQLTTVKELKIGPYRFKNIPTYVYNDSFDVLRYPYSVGLVGNELLRRFNWIINYPKKEIHLQPNNLYYEAFDYSYSGLSIYLIDGFIEVADIAEKSPADYAGFMLGDKLFSVDDKIVTTIKQAKDLLQTYTRKLKVNVLRDNKLKELSIKVISIL